jgi:electron transfer flavoprotein alpha/beta subunit
LSEASPSRALTIAVCVRYTHDVDQIKADPVTGAPVLAQASLCINDFDENGIEAAMRLIDEHGGRVFGVSLVGERPPENLLFQGLAMGLDEHCLVVGQGAGAADALATALALAAAIRRLGPVDLVIASDTSVDAYRGEVGPRLAEALGLPCVTYATQLEVTGDQLRVDRALESAVETVETPMPALVTVGSETNDPRMTTLRHIRQARAKPIVELPLHELPEAAAAVAATTERIATLGVRAPPSERRRVVIDGETAAETARALLDRLLEDAAVKL